MKQLETEWKHHYIRQDKTNSKIIETDNQSQLRFEIDEGEFYDNF